MGLVEWFKRHLSDIQNEVDKYQDHYLDDLNTYSSSTKISCLPDEEGQVKCKKITKICRHTPTEPYSEEIIEEDVPYNQNEQIWPEMDEFNHMSHFFRDLFDPMKEIRRQNESISKHNTGD